MANGKANSRLKIEIKNVVSNDGGNELELFFTDDIYDGFNYDTWTPENMVQDTIGKIKAANPTKITAVINSLGGSVMIGLALYNFLKDYKAQVDTKIIGFAASIASVISLAASNGGKVYMAKNAFMVIHKASNGAWGNASDLRAVADTLDTVTNTIANIYAEKTGKPVDEIKALFEDGDYWMDGDAALKAGFVDELIAADQTATAAINPASLGYNNIPASIAASFGGDKNSFQTIINQFNNSIMDLKKVVSGAFASLKKGAEAVENKVEGEAKAAEKAVEKAVETATAAVEGAAETVENDAEAIVTRIEAAVTAAAEGIENEINAELEAVRAENEKLKNELDKLKNDIAEKLSGKAGAASASAAGAEQIGEWH